MKPENFDHGQRVYVHKTNRPGTIYGWQNTPYGRRYRITEHEGTYTAGQLSAADDRDRVMPGLVRP